jgi:hypothetical protein
MAISVGIVRMVVLADYPEDGTGLLNDANLKLVKLDHEILKPWLSLLLRNPTYQQNLKKTRKIDNNISESKST